MKPFIEICAGSHMDCVKAQAAGADRVELNSALHMGGLTPSLGTFLLAKKTCTIPIISMVRPRGAGFCYDDTDYETMLLDARILLEHGSDGIAFGFLTPSATIDEERTKEMVALIHAFQGEAVFHRAFDCVKEYDHAIECLLRCNVDRVLTSGLAKTAIEGKACLKDMQARYGNQIEILAGCGVRVDNVDDILAYTNVTQIHTSCKGWKIDLTTEGKHVSYAYGDQNHRCSYEEVSQDCVHAFVKHLKR